VIEERAQASEAERDALRAELVEVRRDRYQVLWKALADAGITRAAGCPDSILIEEVTKLRAEKESALADIHSRLARVVEALEGVPLLPSLVDVPAEARQAILLTWADSYFAWTDGPRKCALAAAQAEVSPEEGHGTPHKG
jgi:hypothetical protein